MINSRELVGRRTLLVSLLEVRCVDLLFGKQVSRIGILRQQLKEALRRSRSALLSTKTLQISWTWEREPNRLFGLGAYSARDVGNCHRGDDHNRLMPDNTKRASVRTPFYCIAHQIATDDRR